MLTLMDKKTIGVDEISIFGEVYKVNEPVFDKEIEGKKYDAVIPTVATDGDSLCNVLICFPKFDRIEEKPLMDYQSDEKIIYELYFDGE